MWVAKQDDLALIIRSMSGIDDASVLIAVENKRDFNSEKIATAP